MSQSSRIAARKMLPYVIAVEVFVALIAIGSIYYMGKTYFELQEGWQSVKGEFVRYRTNKGEFFAIASYLDRNGNSQTYYSEQGLPKPIQKRGSAFDLQYHESNPDKLYPASDDPKPFLVLRNLIYVIIFVLGWMVFRDERIKLSYRADIDRDPKAMPKNITMKQESGLITYTISHRSIASIGVGILFVSTLLMCFATRLKLWIDQEIVGLSTYDWAMVPGVFLLWICVSIVISGFAGRVVVSLNLLDCQLKVFGKWHSTEKIEIDMREILSVCAIEDESISRHVFYHLDAKTKKGDDLRLISVAPNYATVKFLEGDLRKQLESVRATWKVA